MKLAKSVFATNRSTRGPPELEITVPMLLEIDKLRKRKRRKKAFYR